MQRWPRAARRGADVPRQNYGEFRTGRKGRSADDRKVRRLFGGLAAKLTKPGTVPLLGKFLFHFLRFLFQRAEGIAGGYQAFIQVEFEKRADAAQPFILDGMRQLMNHEFPFTPAIRTNEDSVAK